MGFPTEKPISITTLTADGAVSVRRFVLNSGRQAYKEGQKVLGVSRDSADDGKSYPATVLGSALVEASAAMLADCEVMTDALGKAKKATAGKYVVGRTRSAVSAAGLDVEVQLYAGGSSIVWTTTTTTSSTTSSSSTTTTTTAP